MLKFLLEIIEVDIITPPKFPNIGVYKILIHLVQFLFAFITLCLTASVISIERSYYGSSQSSVNYTLVISLFTLFILIPLIIIPWTNFSFFSQKLREEFFLKARTNLIFNAFLSICWFIAMISSTVHSNNPSNCNLDSKLQKEHASYESRWLYQCSSAKATSAFCFFSFFLFAASTGICFILFGHEREMKYAVSSQTNKRESSVKDDEMTINVNQEDEEKSIRQPSPTTTPLTLTNDFASPYSPSVTPQMMTAPFQPPQFMTSPYTPSSELPYHHHTSSPLAQNYNNPSGSPAPYSNYPVVNNNQMMVQSPPLYHQQYQSYHPDYS